MANAGVLKPDDRVELRDGEVIQISPIGSPHAACVPRSADSLRRIVRRTAIVWVQNPVRRDDFSEPLPDIALLKPRQDYYASRQPLPGDVLLIIEVADVTLLKDRNVKIPLHGRAGIPEARLINLLKQQIEIYSELVKGRYRKCVKFKRGEAVVSPNLPRLSLEFAALPV